MRVSSFLPPRALFLRFVVFLPYLASNLPLHRDEATLTIISFGYSKRTLEEH